MEECKEEHKVLLCFVNGYKWVENDINLYSYAEWKYLVI